MEILRHIDRLFLSEARSHRARDISTNSSYGARKYTMHSLPFIPARIPDRHGIACALPVEEDRMQLHTLCGDKRTSLTSLRRLCLRLAARPLTWIPVQTNRPCSLTVRAFRQASTTRAREGVCVSRQPLSPHSPPARGSELGWLGPHRIPLCTTRQLLSAAAIRHRRLLHGITVKRAPLRAFPP